MTEALWIGLVVGINVLFRKVFNFQRIIQRSQRTNFLSGYRCLTWEESFFLDSFDQDYPPGLSNLDRRSQEHQPRPEKK